MVWSYLKIKPTLTIIISDKQITHLFFSFFERISGLGEQDFSEAPDQFCKFYIADRLIVWINELWLCLINSTETIFSAIIQRTRIEIHRPHAWYLYLIFTIQCSSAATGRCHSGFGPSAEAFGIRIGFFMFPSKIARIVLIH